MKNMPIRSEDAPEELRPIIQEVGNKLIKEGFDVREYNLFITQSPSELRFAYLYKYMPVGRRQSLPEHPDRIFLIDPETGAILKEVWNRDNANTKPKP